MASENLHSFLAFWAKRTPDRLAVWYDGEEMTWAELDAASNRIAAGLKRAGVRRGDPVGIILSNCLEFVQFMFGAFKVGAPVTLLNTRYTAAEMVHPVTDTGMSLILTEADRLPALEKVRSDPKLRIYSIDNGEGTLPFSDLLCDDTDAPMDIVEGDEVALICYTSGTTGVPKGAMLTHRNIVSAAVMRGLALGQTFEDRSMMALPLAFTGGTAILLRDGIVLGSATYLPRVGDADQCLDVIAAHQITVFACVPVVLERMMMHEKFHTTDLSSLRYVGGAGASCNTNMLETWLARGVEICQGYGQTECGGSYATLLFAEDARRKIGFAGQALPNMEIQIRDDAGSCLGANQAGQIWLRGPTIMKGYLNSPEQTASTLVDGWLNTGDVGLLDEEGYLKILDRAKDLIISGGLNVYPAEIERALSTVSGLVEFAVIGVADAKWGEVPALVTPDLSCVDIAALRAKCMSDLADYKRPKFFIPHDGPLPRTASGKIRKVDLRDMFATVTPSAIPLKEAP